MYEAQHFKSHHVTVQHFSFKFIICLSELKKKEIWEQHKTFQCKTAHTAFSHLRKWELVRAHFRERNTIRKRRDVIMRLYGVCTNLWTSDINPKTPSRSRTSKLTWFRIIPKPYRILKEGFAWRTKRNAVLEGKFGPQLVFFHYKSVEEFLFIFVFPFFWFCLASGGPTEVATIWRKFRSAVNERLSRRHEDLFTFSLPP